MRFVGKLECSLQISPYIIVMNVARALELDKILINTW